MGQWYLGAMARQDLPLATGQCNLLLDWALKLICGRESRGERSRKGVGPRNSAAKGSTVTPSAQPGLRGNWDQPVLQRTARKADFQH